VQVAPQAPIAQARLHGVAATIARSRQMHVVAARKSAAAAIAMEFRGMAAGAALSVLGSIEWKQIGPLLVRGHSPYNIRVQIEEPMWSRT